MRAPRYQFPEEVRSTTRTIASRMVQDGSIAQTPEQLDTWISGSPQVRQSLEKGGYNTAFTSHDLFPLLQVFVVQAGGPPPRVEAPPRRSGRGWLVAVGILLVVLVIVVAMGVLS
jgi:hypothetical protein